MAPTRATYIRRRFGVVGGVLALITASAYLPLTLLAPVDAIAPQLTAADAIHEPAVELTWPAYGASAIGAVGYPGVLASGGSSESLPMASITKVITSLVVLETKPLAPGESGEQIRFTANDQALIGHYQRLGGGTKPVWSGLTLSQRQVLDFTLITSANNYAASLADWAFGFNDEFVAAATSWLQRNGMPDTRVVEPTGIDPANVSTTTDLIQLGKLALADPVIAEIVATASTTVPGFEELENSNKLLGEFGVDGIKTGRLDQSNLLFSADLPVGHQTVQLVGVVMGGEDPDAVRESVRSLLASATSGFVELDVVEAGARFADYVTPWGQHASAVAGETYTVVTWRGTPVSYDVVADQVRDGAAGDRVGRLAVQVGTTHLSVPLVLDSSIGPPDALWRLTNPAELFG
ncbi:D-alanyl-D-alanine carboxypeptidase [Cryobacterium sp. BB307]|uniref:D-alanyl-D-alanine carboxypeptidase family protein n=1 Tax=Cryobacterium sp. BB307 TaxID=2716317 RepID=UPI0014465D51|nr:D-alanyl-D-alanine carboxypeptidase [Cryobacterium sp. BB307]